MKERGGFLDPAPACSPRPPNRDTAKSRIVVRDLGRAGVKETNHTSFRLAQKDRELLRKLAERKYGGITMSAVLRIMIRASASEAGIT